MVKKKSVLKESVMAYSYEHHPSFCSDMLSPLRAFITIVGIAVAPLYVGSDEEYTDGSGNTTHTSKKRKKGRPQDCEKQGTANPEGVMEQVDTLNERTGWGLPSTEQLWKGFFKAQAEASRANIIAIFRAGRLDALSLSKDMGFGEQAAQNASAAKMKDEEDKKAAKEKKKAEQDEKAATRHSKRAKKKKEDGKEVDLTKGYAKTRKSLSLNSLSSVLDGLDHGNS